MPKRAAAEAGNYKTVGRTSDGIVILKPKMSSPHLKKIEQIVKAVMTPKKTSRAKPSIAKPKK